MFRLPMARIGYNLACMTDLIAFTESLLMKKGVVKTSTYIVKSKSMTWVTSIKNGPTWKLRQLL